MTSNLLFITLMGVVSLFSDMTHEGARSILGPFLSLTGASATAVAVVSGAGELCGYSLRLLSGFVADKTHKYWALVIAGYALQVASVPALALVGAGGWTVACALVITERIAKAVKKPAKNTLVSFAASGIGVGKGFAYQEVLDQIGAFAGPVMLFVLAKIKAEGIAATAGVSSNAASTFETYRLCFAALSVPAVITVVFTLIARAKFPHPEAFEKDEEEVKINKSEEMGEETRNNTADKNNTIEAVASPTPLKSSELLSSPLSSQVPSPPPLPEHRAVHSNMVRGGFRPVFALYMAGICLFAFGFADFPLLSLHAAKTGLFTPSNITLLYALAMFSDAISALIFGTLFDRIGSLSLALSTFIAAAFAPLVFISSSTATPIIAGIVLWGVGMGAEESVMKACVAAVMSKSMRSRGFGFAETGFGIAWFAGSVVMGALYDKSRIALCTISVATLAASGICAIVLWRKTTSTSPHPQPRR